MASNLKVCWFCVTISGLWFILSILVVWNILQFEVLELPIALLMGSSVAGVAYQRSNLKWKIRTMILGLPVTYLLLVNLNKIIIFIELILLLIVAYTLFVKKGVVNNTNQTNKLKEQMEQCC